MQCYIFYVFFNTETLPLIFLLWFYFLYFLFFSFLFSSSSSSFSSSSSLYNPYSSLFFLLLLWETSQSIFTTGSINLQRIETNYSQQRLKSLLHTTTLMLMQVKWKHGAKTRRTTWGEWTCFFCTKCYGTLGTSRRGHMSRRHNDTLFSWVWCRVDGNNYRVTVQQGIASPWTWWRMVHDKRGGKAGKWCCYKNNAVSRESKV